VVQICKIAYVISLGFTASKFQEKSQL
jgi:hypothetical protein